MRLVRYNVCASLDGYILDRDGKFDWIPDDPTIDFGALFAKIDTLVMGRVTWEDVQKHGGQLPIGPEGRVYVCSATMSDVTGATVERGDAAALLSRLRAEAGDGEIWLFGGAKLCAAMITAGQVDRVEITVAPVLLGGGTALVGAIPRTSLRLLDTKTYPTSGMVTLNYEVVRA